MFRILVVEDDFDLNRTVCSYLNQNGYEATGCMNANDAYTYSASQQDEVRNIREKYLPKEDNEQEDKMAQLRRLDEGVTRKAMVLSLAIGVIGALVLGVGMCCTMVWTDAMFIPGIFIGIIGIIAVSLAYPLYTKTIKTERERVAPEIMRLSDELMK